MRPRILDILDAVAAEDKRPVRLSVGAVLAQNLLVDARCFVKLVVAAKVPCAVIEVGALVVVKARQRLLSAAVLAGGNGIAGRKLQRAAAHFTFEK